MNRTGLIVFVLMNYFTWACLDLRMEDEVTE